MIVLSDVIVALSWAVGAISGWAIGEALRIRRDFAPVVVEDGPPGDGGQPVPAPNPAPEVRDDMPDAWLRWQAELDSDRTEPLVDLPRAA